MDEPFMTQEEISAFRSVADARDTSERARDAIRILADEASRLLVAQHKYQHAYESLLAHMERIAEELRSAK